MKSLHPDQRSSIPRPSGPAGGLEIRLRYSYRAAWLSILVNLILFGIKIGIGIILSSISVIADAFHTLSDMATSIVVLVGVKVSAKPGDREHPFGHGRAESVAALIICVLLIVAGVELLRTSAGRISDPQLKASRIGWGWAVVIGATALVKLALGAYTDWLSRKIDSTLLRVDSWHHYSDALSTVLVIIALAAGYYGYFSFDGIAGVLVALVVIYTGVKLGHEAISPLLGEPPDPEMVRRIEALAKHVPGVEGVHELIVHRYGHVHVITIHIEVPENRTILELHDVAEQVETAIEREIAGTAVVHLDPICRNHPRYNEIQTLIENEIRHGSRVHSYHDLRLVGHGRRIKAVFDVLLDDGVADADAKSVVAELRNRLSRQVPDVRWFITLDPRYAYST